MQNYQLYLSNLNNPFANLAIEDWFLRDAQFQDQSILFFYINTPAVVIGRAQNPWVECDIKLAKQLGIDLVRRQSGGGTVYHDLGNLNFSFITPKATHDKAKHIEIMIEILKVLGIDAHTNARHDIRVKQTLEEDKGRTQRSAPTQRCQTMDYKISGSAFRETRDRAFHHATLLFNANLKHLSPVINPPDCGIIGAKGVQSVRSPVANLTEINPNATIENFLKATQQYFTQDLIELNQQIIDQNSIIQQTMAELQTWEWIFSKTLPFSQNIDGQTCHIRHGIVEKTGKLFEI